MRVKIKKVKIKIELKTSPIMKYNNKLVGSDKDQNRKV